jgi:hypothetical protein
LPLSAMWKSAAAALEATSAIAAHVIRCEKDFMAGCEGQFEVP